MVGVSHLGELGTPLESISQSNLLISTACSSSLVLISWSWRATSGSTTDLLSLCFRHQIIVTDAVIRQPLWKWTTRWTPAPKTMFMTIANCKFYLSCLCRFMNDSCGRISHPMALSCPFSSQFDPAPRDESWHKSPRTPDYFL